MLAAGTFNLERFHAVMTGLDPSIQSGSDHSFLMPAWIFPEDW
jgi:hypothetical protein